MFLSDKVQEINGNIFSVASIRELAYEKEHIKVINVKRKNGNLWEYKNADAAKMFILLCPIIHYFYHSFIHYFYHSFIHPFLLSFIKAALHSWLAGACFCVKNTSSHICADNLGRPIDWPGVGRQTPVSHTDQLPSDTFCQIKTNIMKQ